MEQIIVYTLDGNVRCQLRNRASGCALVSAEREEHLMSSDTIRISVETIENIDFTIGDYIVIDGCRFRMNQAPLAVRDERETFVYELVYESAKYDLANCMFLLPDEAVGDYQTATLAELLQMIVNNANRVYANQWAVGDCPEDKDIITEQFTEKNCLAVLQELCEGYDYMFRVTESNNVKTINVFENGSNTSLSVEYGRNKGLYSITREATSSEEVITRLYVYGSTENLPTGYPHTRLCLPYTGEDTNVNRRNKSYLENSTALLNFGRKEGVVIFDDEKPHCKSTITAVVISNRCKFVDTAIDFDILAYWQADDFTEFCNVRGYDPNDATVQELFTDSIVGQERKYIVDGSATITFNTGNLAGYSFKLDDYDAATHTFTIHQIVENEGDEILEQYIPDPDSAAYQFAVGDEYVISDIMLPTQFVTAAEQSLRTRASEYFAEHSKVCARYSIEFDRIYMLRNHPDGINLSCGNYIHVKDTQLGINSWIKITRFSRNLLTDEVNVEISDIKKRDPNRAFVDEPREWNMAIEDPFGNSVIGRSQTTLTCIFTPNYNATTSAFNTNAVSITNGLFTDSSLTGRRKVWRLYDRVKSDLLTQYEYKVFVRASKRTQDAEIYFEPILNLPSDVLRLPLVEDIERPQLDSRTLGSRNSNYYYFQIGFLSKTSNRFLAQRGTRMLILQYGEARMPATSVSDGDLIVTNSDNLQVINTATGLGNFNTLTAVDNGTRFDVGAQSARVKIIVDDNNFLRAARVGDGFVVSRMLGAGSVTKNKIDIAARYAREQLTSEFTFENGALSVKDGIYSSNITDADITLQQQDISSDVDGNELDASSEYSIYIDIDESAVCVSKDQLEESKYVYVGLLSAEQIICGSTTRVIAMRPVSTLPNDSVPINAQRISGGSIRDNSGNALMNLATGELKFSRSNGATPVSIRDVDTIVGVDANSGLRKRMTDAETNKANSSDVPTIAEVNTRFANMETIRQLITTIYSEMTDWNTRIATWTSSMQTAYPSTPDFPSSKTICAHAQVDEQVCRVLPTINQIVRS